MLIIKAWQSQVLHWHTSILSDYYSVAFVESMQPPSEINLHDLAQKGGWHAVLPPLLRGPGF